MTGQTLLTQGEESLLIARSRTGFSGGGRSKNSCSDLFWIEVVKHFTASDLPFRRVDEFLHQLPTRDLAGRYQVRANVIGGRAGALCKCRLPRLAKFNEIRFKLHENEDIPERYILQDRNTCSVIYYPFGIK